MGRVQTPRVEKGAGATAGGRRPEATKQQQSQPFLRLKRCVQAHVVLRGAPAPEAPSGRGGVRGAARRGAGDDRLPIAHKDDQYAQYHRMAARMYDALAYNHEAMPLARRARAAGLLPAPPLRPPLGECRRLPAHAARDLRAALPGQAGPGLPLPAVRAPVPGDYGGADAPGAGAAPRSRATTWQCCGCLRLENDADLQGRRAKP